MAEALGTNRDGDTFPIHSRAYRLPAGDAGTRATVQLMKQKAEGPEGAEHPGVRDFALRAVQGCPARDDWAQAEALYHAVKKHVEFRGERAETLQTPWLTLQWGAGDCDDFTSLLVACLLSLGIPANIETIAYGPVRDYRHVYALVGVRNGGKVTWRALDPTVANTKPGWQPPNATRRHRWLHGGTRRQEVLGMNFLHRVKEIGHVAEGFATGGPAGAARSAGMETLKTLRDRERRHLLARAGMQGYRFDGNGLCGYDSGLRPRPPVYKKPLFDIPQADPAFARPRRLQVEYLGSFPGSETWNGLSSGQKTAVAVGGVVLGALLFLR